MIIRRGRVKSGAERLAWFEDGPTLQRLAEDRRALSVLTGAIALVVAGVLVNSARPLFGHSGFGLVIALVSCAAAMALAAAVLGESFRDRLGRVAKLGRVWQVVGFSVGIVTVLAVALDCLALVVTVTR